MRLAARRAPLLFVGLLSMACGMWLGLVRLGWNLPLPWQDQLIAHGPLMVCGFLGTLSQPRAGDRPRLPLGVCRAGPGRGGRSHAGSRCHRLIRPDADHGRQPGDGRDPGGRVATAGFALRRNADDRRAGLDGRQPAVARWCRAVSRRVLVAGVPGADDRWRAARAESGAAADARRPIGVGPGDGDGPGQRRGPHVVAGAGRPRAGRGAHCADVVARASRRGATNRAATRRHAVHGRLPARRLCVAGSGRCAMRPSPVSRRLACCTTRCSTPC